MGAVKTVAMVASAVGVGEQIVSSFNLIYLVWETEIMPPEPCDGRRGVPASREWREVRSGEHLRLTFRCKKTGTMHERRVRLDAKLSVIS